MFDISADLVIKLFLAILLGGLVGFEREKRDRAAGLRTNILVCMGATLVTISSLMFGPSSDPSRIAGQIIVGIGFIGAGVIMKEGGGVRGLTTAASLWVVAGIGLAIGIGFYSGAVLTAISIFFILETGRWFKTKVRKKKEIPESKTVLLNQPKEEFFKEP